MSTNNAFTPSELRVVDVDIETEFELVDLLGEMDVHVRPVRVWWAESAAGETIGRDPAVVLFEADFLTDDDVAEVRRALNIALLERGLTALAQPVRRHERPMQPCVWAPFQGPEGAFV